MEWSTVHSGVDRFCDADQELPSSNWRWLPLAFCQPITAITTNVGSYPEPLQNSIPTSKDSLRRVLPVVFLLLQETAFQFSGLAVSGCRFQQED